MDILVVLLLSLERNLQHIRLLSHTSRFIVQRLDDLDQPVVNVVFFSPEAFMPDTIERFLEVEEIMIELLLMFQVLFHQQAQVEYLFRGTPTGLFLFQDLFCLVY